MRSLLLASVLGLVAAQMRQEDTVLRYYWNENCESEPVTAVIVQQQLCQGVPGITTHPGYKVECAADFSGNGRILFCTDFDTCSNCDVVVNFRKDQCLANDRNLYGSASFSVQCPTRGTGDIPVPEYTYLNDGSFDINYFGNQGCGSAEGNFIRSIVVGRQQICHTVPGKPNSGYKVMCSGNEGVISFCDANCASCNLNTPFVSDGCMNVESVGSSSMSVRCPGSPAAPLIAFEPA